MCKREEYWREYGTKHTEQFTLYLFQVGRDWCPFLSVDEWLTLHIISHIPAISPLGHLWCKDWVEPVASVAPKDFGKKLKICSIFRKIGMQILEYKAKGMETLGQILVIARV